MIDWINQHGGVVAVLLVFMAVYNILLSAAAQLFNALHKSEPTWLQSLGKVGLTISQWLSANTPTPPSIPPKA